MIGRAEKMKLIAVSLSSECIKEPRCSFCYQREYVPYYEYHLLQLLDMLTETYPKATISFEYSGYNLSLILTTPSDLYMCNAVKTMTTMPQAVTPIFCGAIAKHGISAVALSYDSEKVPKVEEWVEKAEMIKHAGMKLSCNFLLESTTRIPVVPREILDTADQLNLLALKPTGKVENIEGVNLLIEYCKNFLPVAVDNCLGYQLGYTSNCGAGKEFCHVMSNGDVLDCCFQSDCFIWLKNNAERVATQAFGGHYSKSFGVSDHVRTWLENSVSWRNI